MGPKIVLPFDMSLRFSSDTIPLGDLGGRLSVSVKHLHVKGRPMTDTGPAAGRLAKSHYVSLANEKGTTFREVSEWLRLTVRKLEADGPLVRLISTRQVEALFWIAMFGSHPLPTPTLDPEVVSSIARVHSQALVENYTDAGPECPTVTWFPDRAS